MRQPTRLLQPAHFERFHCIGADCEDTCCDGWAVTVDKPTYEKYQRCPDPEWRASFEKLITINTTDATDHNYARIQLATTACPFLSEGLCAIHKKFGEEYLSVTCSSFPRVWNVVDDVLERSLDMGCPEAARMALLDPDPLGLEPGALTSQDFSMARISAIDTANGATPGKPYQHFGVVRAFVVWLLQYRADPLWKRLLILGLFCDKLQEMAAGTEEAQIPNLVQAYREAVTGGLFNDALNQLHSQTQAQLETVLELIVARITSDFTNRKFLECYKQLMDGIEWGPDSTMEQIGGRYAQAHKQYYAPFMTTNEHMLEHYLVNYVCRSLFPFGPQESTYKLRDQNIQRSVHTEFMLMAVNFAIIQALLTGLAAFHKEGFGAPQVIQVVYTFTRTFEHSLTFPQRVMQILTEKGLDNPAGVALLIRH